MLKIKTICTTLIGGKIYKINGRTIIEEKLISEGAYSFVYMAKDLNTNKIFALKKTICQDKEQLEMTNREINVLKSLPPHKNIVQYYGSTVLDENNFKIVLMLMEFCERGNLLNIFEKNKDKIKEAHIIKIMKDIMCGLNFLHVQEIPIIHRDIKLENILCDEKGVYKICDFGSHTISKSIYPNDLEKPNLCSLKEEIERDTTLMYRPPELIDLYANLEISSKIDIWMAGCILYLLLFKVHPFQNNSFLTILNCSYKIPNNIKFSKRILSVLIMMLSKNPEKRIDSTTLLYIFENYGDLKKWIIHVSNDIKKKVNAICEKIEEINAENKQNKNIEINNDNILDCKIGNEEYENKLVSNSNTMPLNVASKGFFFSNIGKGGEKVDSIKKKDETNKSTVEEKNSNNVETNENKESSAISVNNNKDTNNIIKETNGTEAEVSDSTLVNNEVKNNYSKSITHFQGTDNKTNSRLNCNFGKTNSFTNNQTKKTEEEEEERKEENCTSTDNLIKIDVAESKMPVVNNASQNNNKNGIHVSYNESNNLFDLSDNMDFTTNNNFAYSPSNTNNNNNNKNGNNNNNINLEANTDDKLLDLSSDENLNIVIENDIKCSNIHSNIDENIIISVNEPCANENKKVGGQGSKTDSTWLFGDNVDMFSNESKNNCSELMNLNDNFRDNGENTKNYMNSFAMNVTSKDKINSNDNVKGINNFNNINSNNIKQINCIDNNNSNNITKSENENFGSFFDPWNCLPPNECKEKTSKNEKEKIDENEKYSFLSNDISLNPNCNYNVLKNPMENSKNDYNKLESDFFFHNTNFTNANIAENKFMWDENSLNNKNNINYKNDKDTNNFLDFNYEKYDNVNNNIKKTLFVEEEKYANSSAVGSSAFNGEKGEHKNYNYKLKTNDKNKSKNNRNAHLITSDKNDQFSELLDEFQKM